MKKTLTIVALSLIGLIIIATIVLGFVNTNFAQINIDNATSVTLYKDGKVNTYYKNDDGVATNTAQQYKEIADLYNKESKVSILTALFTGAYSTKADIVNENTTISNKISSGYWLVFEFDEEQTLKLNGKEYVDSTSTSSDPVTFTKVVLQVTNTQGMQLVTAYICESSSASQATYTMSIYANQTALYEYINDAEIF